MNYTRVVYKLKVNGFMAKIKFDKDDIRLHLQLEQDIINRMASNSANCKTWLITIVAALTALQITRDDISSFGWLMPLLCLMFWYLDSYYLALEKKHRDKEKSFINTLSNLENSPDGYEIDGLYDFSLQKDKCRFCEGIVKMGNSSTLPFYLTLIILFLLLSYGKSILGM